jgi:2-dehydropantoate 2-reductase
MRICIFGVGSLGSALGGMLSSGHEVTLIGRKPHVDAINSSGLRLVGDVNRLVRLEARESLKRSDQFDLLIVTTKAYDTEEAVSECRRLTTECTKVLTLQNGLENLEILREWKGALAFGGTTTMGAVADSPGKVRISGLGRTIIGADLDPRGANEIAVALSGSGIPTTVEKDVMSAIWTKAVVSACINPLTAVLRIRNGRLLENAVISKLMSEICRECVAVAASEGFEMTLRTMNARVRAVVKDTADNRSSMFQDIARGRRTEIDQISGVFCQKGEENGISTPLNRCLAAMVNALETHSATQKG